MYHHDLWKHNFENVYGCFLTQSHRIRIHVTSNTHIQSHNIKKTNSFTSSDTHPGILDNCSDSKCATRQQEESSARMAITSAALLGSSNPTCIVTDNLFGIHSDILFNILSDILSGIYSDILSAIFWHSFWHSFLLSIWHLFWHLFWHLHGILSDIISNILSGIYPWHAFWQIMWYVLWHSLWHCLWHSDIDSDILSAILSGTLSGILCDILSGMCSGPGVPSCIRSWRYGVRAQPRPTGSKSRRKEWGCEGVAPVLKSRDPHLAGGEKVSYKSTNINKQSTKQTKITQQTNHTLGIPEVHIPKDVMSPHAFPFRFNDWTTCPMAQMAEANGSVAFMQTLIDMAGEKAEKMAGFWGFQTIFLSLFIRISLNNV